MAIAAVNGSSVHGCCCCYVPGLLGRQRFGDTNVKAGLPKRSVLGESRGSKNSEAVFRRYRSTGSLVQRATCNANRLPFRFLKTFGQ